MNRQSIHDGCDSAIKGSICHSECQSMSWSPVTSRFYGTHVSGLIDFTYVVELCRQLSQCIHNIYCIFWKAKTSSFVLGSDFIEEELRVSAVGRRWKESPNGSKEYTRKPVSLVKVSANNQHMNYNLTRRCS